MKRLNDSSDVPEARLGNLAKNIYKLKEKDKAAFYFPAEEWVLPASSTKELEERESTVDSGASVHMVSKRDLNSVELETMRTSRSPTTVMSANGEVQIIEEATADVEQWTYLSKLCFLKKLSQFFPWENSVRIMGIHTTGRAVKNHISSEMTRELIDCNISNYVPFVVPGLSASSASTTPSPTSSSSSSQDSVSDVNRYNENPVPERSGSTSEELRGNPLHESTETEKPK